MCSLLVLKFMFIAYSYVCFEGEQPGAVVPRWPILSTTTSVNFRIKLIFVPYIPRLELMAAMLGLKLAKSITDVLRHEWEDVIFWSDSTNVLCWIRGRSRSFKPFVAYRVGEIQQTDKPQSVVLHTNKGYSSRHCITWDNSLQVKGVSCLVEWPRISSREFWQMASKQSREKWHCLKEQEIHSFIGSTQGTVQWFRPRKLEITS